MSTVTTTAEDIGATAVTRRLIKMCEDGGLRPRIEPDPDRHGRIAVILNGPGRENMFGVIYVSALTGKALSAYLTPGNSGTEQRHDSVAEIRAALKAWFASPAAKAAG
jgi:hypothetical protein